VSMYISYDLGRRKACCITFFLSLNIKTHKTFRLSRKKNFFAVIQNSKEALLGLYAGLRKC
jgi:hypothetical protein